MKEKSFFNSLSVKRTMSSNDKKAISQREAQEEALRLRNSASAEDLDDEDKEVRWLK